MVKKEFSKRLWLMVIPLAIFIIVSDQITKFATEAAWPVPHNFRQFPEEYPVDPEQGVPEGWKHDYVIIEDNGTWGLKFDHVINQGAAWGIFQGKMGPLSMISAAVFIFLIWYYPRFTEGYLERDICYGLLQGGIFGNFIDRVGCFGRIGVVDFFDCRIFAYDFPAFNIADAAICVGVFSYCLSSFIRPDKKKSEKQNKSDDSKPESSEKPAPEAGS